MTRKNSGFERDSNPQPLCYQCNALSTELSKPHESGRDWVEYSTCNAKVVGSNPECSKPEMFSGHFPSSVMIAFTSLILSSLSKLVMAKYRQICQCLTDQ